MSVEEYVATAAACGVDRAVLVQAHGAYGADNAYVLDAVAAAPDRLVSVVIVDPDGPGRARDPAPARGSPGCAGVRLFGIGAVRAGVVRRAGRRRALWEAARPSSASGSSPRCSPPSCPGLRRMLERFPRRPGGARPLRLPRSRGWASVRGRRAAHGAGRVRVAAPQGHVARRWRTPSTRAGRRGVVRRTARTTSSAPIASCGVPTTRRPTTARTRRSSRSGATRAPGSRPTTGTGSSAGTRCGSGPALTALTGDSNASPNIAIIRR